MIDPETEYLMARAKEEAVLAIQAEHPAAAAAHEGLSVRYSAKAMIELADAEDNKPAPPIAPRQREG
jgi:hypothetical protein